MNKKIFRSISGLAVSAMLVCVACLFLILFSYFEKQLQTELEQEMDYAEYAVEQDGVAFLENCKEQNRRMTLIGLDGTVLYDTATDASSMENHKDRKEVQEAMIYGSGSSIRYSATLMEKTIYYARRLSDGRVLRISTDQSTAVSLIVGLIVPVGFAFLVVVALSVLLSSRLVDGIVQPINKLDLDHPYDNDTYEELSPLLHKIAVLKDETRQYVEENQWKSRQFDLLTDCMTEGVVALDEEGHVSTCNQAALALFDVDHVYDKNVYSLNRSTVFRELVESVSQGQSCEKTLTTGAGSCQVVGRPVFQAEGKKGALIVIRKESSGEEVHEDSI